MESQPPRLLSDEDRPEDRDGFVRADEIVELLLRTAHGVRALLASQLNAFGLNDVRYLVLKAVADAGPTGCSQSELAAALQQSESNVCTLVDRMRNDGLIYRRRSKTDRRKRLLLLTKSARHALELIRPIHDEQMEKLLANIEPQQRKLLQEILERLSSHLTKHTVLQPAPRSVSAPVPPNGPHFLMQDRESHVSDHVSFTKQSQ